MSSFDGLDVKVIDTREMALIVLVDSDGMANVRAQVDKKQAAEWMRHLADEWSRDAEGES